MTYPSEVKFPIEPHSYLSCPAHHLRVSQMPTRIFLAATGMKTIYSNTRKKTKRKKSEQGKEEKWRGRKEWERGGKKQKDIAWVMSPLTKAGAQSMCKALGTQRCHLSCFLVTILLLSLWHLSLTGNSSKQEGLPPTNSDLSLTSSPYQKQSLHILIRKVMGRTFRDGLVAKSYCCLFKGPKFSSTESDTLFSPPWACIHTCRQSKHTHKIEVNKSLKRF